jgi:nucleoside-diphosphate-sugar epimerase
MRFLITGGAGFIGSHLSERLLARGDEVHIIDDLPQDQSRIFSTSSQTRISTTISIPSPISN